MEEKKFENEKVDAAYREYVKKNYNNSVSTDIKTIIHVVIGSLLLAVNMKVFLRAGNMIPAGFSGIAVLSQEISHSFFGVEIPFTPLSLILNVFPAFLCFRHVGRKFTLFSFVSVILVSVFTDFIPMYPITGDRLLIAVFGGIIAGFGSSLILKSGACSGGTDFISMYFTVKNGTNTFGTVMIFNCLLITASGLLFGADSAMYTIIYQFIATQVVTSLYNRFSKKTLLIVTEHPKEVSETIMETTHHDCTIINDTNGSYSGNMKYIVYAVVGASETSSLNLRIKSVDPESFINVLLSESVSGKFFQRPFN